MATLKTWGCGPLVWGGDANTDLHGHKCKIEGLIGESILRRSNLKRAMARDMVRRRARFVEFIEKHELVITNSFITNNSKLYTHKNNRSKVKTQIDFLGVSGNADTICAWVDNGDNLPVELVSDHFVVGASLHWCDVPFGTYDVSRSRRRLVGWKVDDGHREKFGEMIMNTFEETKNLDDRLNKLQEQLVSTARLVPFPVPAQPNSSSSPTKCHE